MIKTFDYMPKIKSLILIIFFSIIAFTYNYVNVKSIISSSKVLKFGYTYQSPDDHTYVDPAINFVKGLGYIIDPSNEHWNVRRTPGYSVFYGVHYLLFGYEMSFFWIRISQCLLFGISVILLRKSLLNLHFSIRVSTLAMYIYGLSPFVIGFLFNTITEAIHPEFVVIFFFLYSKTQINKTFFNYFILGIFGVVVILIRPTNILAPMIIGFMMVLDYLQNKLSIKYLIFYVLGLIVLWSPWIIRNYNLKNEFIPLEKYYKAPTNYYGALQLPLERFWMCWGNPRHEYLLNNISFDLAKLNKYETIDKFIAEQPDYVYTGVSKQELRASLIEVSNCYQEMIAKKGGLGPYKHTDSVLVCDQLLHDKFNKMRDNFAEKQPFLVYVYAPLIIRIKAFVFHSFSSSYPLLNNETDLPLSIWQKMFKIVFYILNVSLFLSLIISILYLKSNKNLFFLISFPISLMLFYVYYYHIEARYIISTYPFMSALLSFIYYKFIDMLKSKKFIFV